MKHILQFFYLAAFTALFVGCTKEPNDDLSFLATAKNPDKISALFEITQDNTGLVTITPTGEGVTTFDVFFGDGTATPVKVAAGKNVQHKYAEGIYNVKLVGYNVTGKTTEATQQLTVTFRAPENLEVTATIDPSNSFKVNVTAKAQYETFFRVFFGHVANEVPVSFNEGQTVSHVYSATGTYTLRVVALSGGAATTEYTQTITIVNPVLLPLTFETPGMNYDFINFGGGAVSVIDNPEQSGINTSGKVGRMVKNPPEGWGGSVITLGEPIDFSSNKVFRMKVFSPRVGARVLLKVENVNDGGIFFEKEATSTVANAWEELGFDFSTINTNNSYQKVVLIFDLGTPGDGSANYTWLFDDIRLTNAMPGSVAVPLDFEASGITYNWFNFDGGNATVINNPDASGINTSAKVGRMIKNAGQTWGGSFLTLTDPINFSNKVFRMKVWSPRVGAKVLLKVENSANPNQNFERTAESTVANAWEDLVFDYTGIPSGNFDRIVLIFDNGTAGDGSSNFTFYFDDIRLQSTFPISVPLNFEYPVTYDWFNFDGGNATVIDNPDASGINTSTKVVRMIKNPGQPWGGSFLTLAGPIDFTRKNVRLKVWSPRVGANVLLKVENSANANQNFEVSVPTTVANAWQELTFNYAAIPEAQF
ncbi:MAG: hypothetical protein ACO3BD_05205, partial [Chitinophagaceae bacterium]